MLVSGNGSHFSSYDVMYYIYRMNARLLAEAVSRLWSCATFSPRPSGGPHFSYSKGTLRIWVASGYDVFTPRDIFIGLTRGCDDGSDLVQASSVAFVKPCPVKMAKGPRAPTNMWRVASGGMGIRSVADCQFKYDDASIVVSQPVKPSG